MCNLEEGRQRAQANWFPNECKSCKPARPNALHCNRQSSTAEEKCISELECGRLIVAATDGAQKRTLKQPYSSHTVQCSVANSALLHLQCSEAAVAAHNYHRERYIVLLCTPGWSTCHNVIIIITIIIIIHTFALTILTSINQSAMF